MRKIVVFLSVLVLAMACSFSVCAADGLVTYSGNAGNFVYEPGSEHSLTDLFPNFKGVMPGDTLTQKITVKNNADNKVKVKIYLRSLGAQENSKEFLSQLTLKVKQSDDNKMAYMFDAAADETAQLKNWVCLGTLYSGGEVNLDVTLAVPVELSNEYQNNEGFIDWEFMIEEFPIEPTDPKPPQTGDNTNIALWLTVMLVSLVTVIILLVWRKKQSREPLEA